VQPIACRSQNALAWVKPYSICTTQLIVIHSAVVFSHVTGRIPNKTTDTPPLYSHSVRESVEFQVQANRVRLQLPQALLPPSVKSVLGQSVALSGGKERICQVIVNHS
jgi:hypothetical protein